MRLGEVVFELGKSYEYQVAVEGAQGTFAGSLKLTPEKITLRVSGDEQIDRRWGEFKGWELKSIKCVGFKCNFLLFDLHIISHGSFGLEHRPSTVQHFEVEYVASYAVICSSGQLETDIREVHLFSPSLRNWVGHTEKQEEIMHDQLAGSAVGLKSPFGDFDTREFSVDIDGLGEVCVNYNLKATASPLEFTVGVQFPPSFCICSDEQILPEDVMQLYQKSYSFLSLLHGRELSIDKILLVGVDAYSSNAYLYYPKPALLEYEASSYSLFPLGHNVRFDSLGLPSLPLESIATYFSEGYKYSEKWGKYIKYRRMSNVEERFLGYFRLLESLTKASKTFLDAELLSVQVARIEKIMVKIFGDQRAVRGFLRGIGRYNNSKYNTEKCILDFYNKLPGEIRKNWRLKQDAITAICKLRNDISHANDYFEKSDDLLSKCAFVESLLIIALLETVGIPIAVGAKIIHRLAGSHNLRGEDIQLVKVDGVGP